MSNNIVTFTPYQRDPRARDFGIADLSCDAINTTEFLSETFTNRGWTNQELASIYRAIRLLRATGLVVDTDRGVADDGSPWYVLCNPHGDVLVHIARIDCSYVLDGVGLEAPLKGRTFDDLVNKFFDHEIGRDSSRVPDSQTDIVDLSVRRQNKVFIHPAAQFAALIWAAMIVNDLKLAGRADAPHPELLSDEGHALEKGVGLEVPGLVKDESHARETKANPISGGNLEKFREGHATIVQHAGFLALAHLILADIDLTPTAGLDFDWFEAMESAATDDFIAITSPQRTQWEDVFRESFFITDLLHVHKVDKTDYFPFSESAALDFERDLQGPNLKSLLPDIILHENYSIDRAPNFRNLEVEKVTALDLIRAYSAEGRGSGNSDNIEESGQRASQQPTLEELIDLFFLESKNTAESFDLYSDEILAFGLENGVDQNFQADGRSSEQPLDDIAVINAIYEFLLTAHEDLTYYWDGEVHVVKHGNVDVGSMDDEVSRSWTFEDGSQIKIIGLVEDLEHLHF